MSVLAGQARFGNGPAELGAAAIPLRGGRGELVADARIDNRIELEGRMRIEPARAREMGDAELLAAAIERWGESAVEWIVGDYAFAWWDASAARLLLARDFAGTRPLAWTRGESAVAFGSRLEGERVPAGHMVTLTEGGAALRRWWRPDPRPLGLVGDPEYAEALHARLDEAVRSRLRGVAEAAVVQGGSGADAVTAAAQRHLGVGKVRRVASVEEAGPGVALTSLLAPLTIGYAGSAFLPSALAGAPGLAAFVPGVASRARAQRLAALDGLDLADALAGPPGVMLRDPTADRRLIEFCISVPERQFLRGLARRAFGG